MIVNYSSLERKTKLSPHEMRLLKAHILKVNSENLFFNDITLNNLQEKMLQNLVKRRLKGEPLAKILKKKEFYGREFKTNQYTLDPRPDSETLIEVVNELMKNIPKAKILDLGTGTGCLLLTLLAEHPNTTGVGVDVTLCALRVAKYNMKKLNLESRCQLLHSNWFDQVEGAYDLIISNPPYVSKNDKINTGARFDPYHALYAENNGYEAYEKIFQVADSYLKPNGKLVFEIGFAMQEGVNKLAAASNFQFLGFQKDLAGVPRVLWYSAKEKNN